MPEPKLIPAGDPVPFALSDIDDAVWPIVTGSARKYEITYEATDGTIIGANQGRRFLASRSNGTRRHVGLDLFCEEGDKVRSAEEGRVMAYYGFYTTNAGELSYALMVQHEDFVVNYGEVKGNAQQEFGWRVGEVVGKGQEIARVSSTNMIHFETYVRGTAQNQRWMVGQPRPQRLLNPTRYLLSLASQAQGLGIPQVPDGGEPATTLQAPQLAANADLQRVAARMLVLQRSDMRREAVGVVQDALDALPDASWHVNAGTNRGFYGPRTESAVRTFQAAKGIGADGVVGFDTITALDRALIALDGQGGGAGEDRDGGGGGGGGGGGNTRPFRTPPARSQTANGQGGSTTTGLQGQITTPQPGVEITDATERVTARRDGQSLGAARDIRQVRTRRAGVSVVQQASYPWRDRQLPEADLVESFPGFPSEAGVFSGRATFFGKSDNIDEGTGSPAFGTVQNNSSVFGISLKRQRLIDAGLAVSQNGILRATEAGLRARVEVYFEETGRLVRLPIVDVGPRPNINAVADLTVAATAFLQNKTEDDIPTLRNITVQCRIVS